MKVIFAVLRSASPGDTPVWQEIPYETDDMGETVATALTALNEAAVSPDPQAGCDAAGRKITPIRWECACLQKKCGACAMVINGRPGLACDSFLRDCGKRGRITLEPLSKFPVVADLQVDRSVLSDHLQSLQAWQASAAAPAPRRTADVYDAARCLQCGCCLEVCPQVYPGGEFYGAAGFVPAAGLLLTDPAAQAAQSGGAYRQHVYNGCAKSLACEKICPAGIDINRLLAKSAAIAVWRIHGRKK